MDEDHNNNIYGHEDISSIGVLIGDDDEAVHEAAEDNEAGCIDDGSDDDIPKLDEKKSKATMRRIMLDVYKNESTRFALRITAAMTMSSLFVLLSSPVPEPTFIQITAGIVCWQPTNDIGSVLKKAWQRTVGTTIGGLIGLGVGGVSLLIEPAGSSEQALYLGLVTAAVNYSMAYFANAMGLREHYSAVLGTLTAGFVTLAFFDENGNDAWSLGAFRIVNIIIGGLIGSICCLVVFPESTKRKLNHVCFDLFAIMVMYVHAWLRVRYFLYLSTSLAHQFSPSHPVIQHTTDLVETKVGSQIKMTGNAAKEVLSMTAKYNEGIVLPTYQAIVKNSDIQDAAHSAYISAILNVNDVRNLFTLLDYDPMFRRLTKEQQTNFISTNRIKLGRLLRTQMNILQIDTFFRCGISKCDTLNTKLLQRVGQNIEIILDRSNPQTLLDQTADRLLKHDLPSIRHEVKYHLGRTNGHRTLQRDTSTFSDEELCQLLSSFDDVPKREFIEVFFDIETDIFYRQVETLIVRCLRLHHIWPLEKL